MMEITVLLLVFVLSLVIGILLLDLTSPKKGEVMPVQDDRVVEQRVERLEKMMLKNGNSVLSYNLKDKLHKLDNFRANTEVEIEGLKEAIDEVKEFSVKGKIKKKKKPSVSKQEQLETKKMSSVIFNSG